VVVGDLLFSQCNVAWRSFPWARGSGYQSFDSPYCFISAKCGSSVSVRFWSHGAHTVCFCVPVTILDPLSTHFKQPLTINLFNSYEIYIFPFKMHGIYFSMQKRLSSESWGCIHFLLMIFRFFKALFLELSEENESVVM
jgi:hypothetical protein